MSALSLRFLRRGTVAPVLPSITYDNRFGTDATTAAATGWFTFGLHSGNRRIWVDSSQANDTGNGLTAATAKKTFDAAYTLWATGFTSGDQLMVAGKGGRTYTNHAADYLANKGGISATYPTAILSYDPTDAANTAKYGKLTGADMPIIALDSTVTYGNSFSNNSNDVNGFYAVQGIAFNGQDIDSNSISWQQRHDGLVWQNCRFNAVALVVTEGGAYDATGASYNQAGNVSKCSFYGSWVNTGTNTSGVYFHSTKDFWIQDCVFAHCGWRIGSSRDDVVRFNDGGATVFNHGNYVSASETGIRIDRVFYTDTAADGFNLRSNGDATSIVSLDDAIAANIGAFSGNVNEAPNGVLTHIDDWLIMGGADIRSDLPRGEGMWTTNTISGSYARNVAAFDNPKFTHGGDQLIVAYNPFTVAPSAITHSGTTATVTSNGHGFTTGQKLSFDHVAPTDYNMVNVAITVIDANTFTYTMATTPATNATSVGLYTYQVPQYMLLDKWRAYNYASTLDGATQSANVIDAINNTWTNAITDVLAPGGGNQVSSAGLFPSYQTRDQVVTAVLNGISITPGANYYARKSQLINAAAYRPDLPWAQWLIGVGLPSMGLTPKYATPSYAAYTDTPTAVYATSLGSLTLSTLNFTRGTGSYAVIGGVSALPVLSSSDLPSGFSISQFSQPAGGNTASGSNQLTSISNTTGVTPGMFINNPSGNIPTNTYIVSISGTTATMSANATGTATGTNVSFLGGGRIMRYDGSGSGAATPTLHIKETTQDGSTNNTTAFTLNIT